MARRVEEGTQRAERRPTLADGDRDGDNSDGDDRDGGERNGGHSDGNNSDGDCGGGHVSDFSDFSDFSYFSDFNGDDGGDYARARPLPVRVIRQMARQGGRLPPRQGGRLPPPPLPEDKAGGAYRRLQPAREPGLPPPPGSPPSPRSPSPLSTPRSPQSPSPVFYRTAASPVFYRTAAQKRQTTPARQQEGQGDQTRARVDDGGLPWHGPPPEDDMCSVPQQILDWQDEVPSQEYAGNEHRAVHPVLVAGLAGLEDHPPTRHAPGPHVTYSHRRGQEHRFR